MACNTTPIESGIEFDSTIQHSLCRLGVVTITPKPEQRKAVYSNVPGQRRLCLASHRIRDNEVLPFVMNPKLGRVGSTASPV